MTDPKTGKEAPKTAPSTLAPLLGTGPATRVAESPLPGEAPAGVAPSPDAGFPEDFAKITKAIHEFIGGVLSSVPWAIVVLVILFVARVQLLELLQTLKKVIEERGVSLDVATFFKLQVAEQAFEAHDDWMTIFSRSPLEIEEDVAPNRSSVLSEIRPQLEFQVSDYVGRHWSSRDDANQRAANAMRDARERLRSKCRGTISFSAVKSEFVNMARRLEVVRFLEADTLVPLLNESAIQVGIDQIQSGLPTLANDDVLILHCAGATYAQVAHAQEAAWAKVKRLLDRIMWDGQKPSYLPAGGIWLTSAYHDCIRTLSPSLDVDSADFFTTVRNLLDQGRQIFDAMGNADWSKFPVSNANVGYYKREILKTMGNIASFVGEHSRDANQKKEYLRRAEEALTKCTEDIDNDSPSPLDYNNLADLYRQIGDHEGDTRQYERAHEQLGVAFNSSQGKDPAFYDTRARIFWKQGHPLRGVLALEQYGETEAARANTQDAIHYVANQILAAKLAVIVDPDSSTPYLALAAGILEATLRFISCQREKLGDTADQCQVDVLDGLAFTYLMLPGNESRAVAAYDRLLALREKRPSGEARWRRQVCRVRALTRLVRAERLRFSSHTAAQQRKRAYDELANSAATVKPFGLDADVPILRRRSHFRLRLDTAVVLQ